MAKRSGKYTLTLRNGPQVRREQFDALDDAVEALRDRVREVRAEGNLGEASMIRTYTPAQRVKARLELTTGGMFRRREAGLDVMGDGAMVPYAGGTFKRKIAGTDDPILAVEGALREMEAGR